MIDSLLNIDNLLQDVEPVKKRLPRLIAFVEGRRRMLNKTKTKIFPHYEHEIEQ